MSPTEEELRVLIEQGRINEAVARTAHLSPLRIDSMLFLGANDNPSENYMDFLLAAAEHRAGTLEEVAMIDSARALLVTALAPLDDAFGRALTLHLRSIDLARRLLIDSIEQLSFFRSTPGHELDEGTAREGRVLIKALSQWRPRPPGENRSDPR
jgi:hypothetical protein